MYRYLKTLFSESPNDLFIFNHLVSTSQKITYHYDVLTLCALLMYMHSGHTVQRCLSKR